MEDLRNDRLEELCVKLIKKEETSVADEIVEEAVRIIVEAKNIMIDGEVMEDGSVDRIFLWILITGITLTSILLLKNSENAMEHMPMFFHLLS